MVTMLRGSAGQDSDYKDSTPVHWQPYVNWNEDVMITFEKLVRNSCATKRSPISVQKPNASAPMLMTKSLICCHKNLKVKCSELRVLMQTCVAPQQVTKTGETETSGLS